MPTTRTRPEIQERCIRWLLLLTILHTVPVIWITPVAAGTAPTLALLAFGVGGFLSFDNDGFWLGLIAFLPALVYCAIAWILAWSIGKGLERIPRSVRALLLAIVVTVLLVAPYFPIYVAGGHNSSSSAALMDLFDNTLDDRLLIGYWMALHGLLAVLYAGHFLRVGHPLAVFVERWRKPTLNAVSLILVGAVFYGYYPLLVCKPLGALGSARAQVCAAQAFPREARYWYERAGGQGDAEAIGWLIDNTSNRAARLRWLRKGAEQGYAAIQFALHQHLVRFGGPAGLMEAQQWLNLAVEGDHAPAPMVLVDRLSKELYRSQSREQLVLRNAWLERAAELGSRMAMLRLAQHYVDGSMGYSSDLERARAYYLELAQHQGEPTAYERALQLNAASYRQRADELNEWKEGLRNHDPVITKAMAERYLASQLPGPGVQELGFELMTYLAEQGDTEVRDDLIVSLRTGSGGLDKDVDAARGWLIKAAEAGDVKAMERLASNYMSGREGVGVDYPEARRWIESLIELVQNDQARLRGLHNQLAYIDRLSGYAGSEMLGSDDLKELGERTDAESHYRYSQQLLAGHGSERRAEAVARLGQAAQLGHGGAAWRLFQIYERGFEQEVDPVAAMRMLELAVSSHHFNAARELAMSLEYGKRGLPVDLSRAIALYEVTLEAGRDNRYDWDLDPDNFNHFKWLESRLRQAKMKQSALADNNGV
jgi:TPR repeat protein